MARGRAQRRKSPQTPGNSPELWIYGFHAVSAALKNSHRMAKRVLFLKDILDQVEPLLAYIDIEAEPASRDQMAKVLPPGAVHQGIAALMSALPRISLEDICQEAKILPNALIVILDRVSDPQNIGAIIRSASVLGAIAVIIQDRNAPQITGVIAKAASGGIEHIPLVRVINLSRAMETLKKSGFWCIGLDSDATTELQQVKRTSHSVLVLGSEGTGLRRLVREKCDELARIQGSAQLTSLNVSNAAAIALYEIRQAPKTSSKI
ncbi:MAG: 23S rRNA (guanosine(2251)-2'-O)-methyltransferase RlmB [Rhodospirillaceae bacterium]|nr:23S rRNA (guanosine(2251)-2'-O)-methyltransferase RlmB [Rhodospirillaceae bacterium]